MDTRQKVIILSYFFPPCNLTPSERIYSWAKYLPKGNYHPIIITRNWDLSITNATTDICISSGDELKIENHEGYETHFIPFKQTFRDKIFVSYYGKKNYKLYLVLQFFWSLMQLPFLKLSSSYDLYKYTRQYIKNHPDVKLLIVSVSPFELLGFANRLAKEFNLKWIADYRDDWSTNEMQFADSLPKKILNQYNRIYEKKWLKSASLFMTVSDYYQEKLSLFLNKPGITVENGYMHKKVKGAPHLFEKFTITYLGSLYPSQELELFVSAFKQLIAAGHDQLKIVFIGLLNEPPIKNRIEKALIGYENYYEITSRIPKAAAHQIQQQSHMLLAIAYQGKKGIPGSKLYDYISTGKKVLLCPSDHDIIEKSLMASKQAIICNTIDETVNKIRNAYLEYVSNTFEDQVKTDADVLFSFSREYQTNKMIHAMDALTKTNK